MLPCKRHPISALFFANLMKELAPKVNKLIIVTPRPYIPNYLLKIKKSWRKWYLDTMISKEHGMDITRPHVLTLPGIRFEGINGVLMQYSLFPLIRNLTKKGKIDLILGYNMLPEGIAAVRLAKMFNLPVGFWAIGSDVNDFAKYNLINYYFTKKCIEKSDIIFTESKDLEKKIRGFSGKSARVQTFYKGIDISNFLNLPSKNVLMKHLELKREKRYILFVGRLTQEKGIYELAETFNIISKQYSDFNLILIGEELEKEKLTAKFREYRLLNRILFKGMVSHEEIATYMKISDLLVLPTWAEGLPNVVMEAMASGLPVIATDVGGIPEILANGVTGLSVPAKDVETLTEAVIKMIENKDLREKCIRNAKKLIYEKFDVKKNVHQLYNLLKELKR